MVSKTSNKTANTKKKIASKSVAGKKKSISKKPTNEAVEVVSGTTIRKGSKRFKFMKNLRRQEKLQNTVYQEDLKQPKDRDRDNKDLFHCFSKATIARLVRLHTGEGDKKKYVSRNYLCLMHLTLEALLTIDIRNASRVSGEKRKVTTTQGDFELVVKHMNTPIRAII